MFMDKNKFQPDLDNLKIQNLSLKKIITPITKRYPFLEEKEIMELCQIGKFLYNINSNIRILEKPQPPNPDFIIDIMGKEVGLEHTRLTIDDAEKKRKYFSVVDLIEYDAAKEFKKRYPNELRLVNFFLKNDALEIRKHEKELLVDIVCNYVNDVLNGKCENKPNFVEDIEIMKHDKLSFNFIENSLEGSHLSFEHFREVVKKKETKLNIYKEKSMIDEYWLVLVGGSLNSVSLKIDDNINYKMESTFDKVFLVSDFNGQIISVSN